MSNFSEAIEALRALRTEKGKYTAFGKQYWARDSVHQEADEILLTYIESTEVGKLVANEYRAIRDEVGLYYS